MRHLAICGLLALLLATAASGEHRVPRPSRRVALLIGIANYEYFTDSGPPGQTTLHGPIHDVERMRVSLRRFGFDGSDDVRVLTNSQASREGIAAGFHWLMERASDSADVVVVFYSGHGSNARDVNGDKGLTPWDARDIHDATQLILDDSIGAWLQAVRTRNVTVILDACFSGTGMRGSQGSVLARAKGPLGSTSDTESVLGPDHDNVPYTLIAASGASEVAQEEPLGDDRMVFGVLTFYLTRALDAAGPATHYDEVVQQVTFEIRGILAMQTPQLEGDRGALLFHVGEAMARRQFALVAATGRGRASIDVGAVHGVRRSAIYDVYPPGETVFGSRGVLAHLRVDSVEDVRSWATLDSVDTVPTGARAILSMVPRGARSRDKISVHVEVGDRLQALLGDSMPFVSLADSSSAEVHVQSKGGVIRVLADGIVLPPLPEDPGVRRATVGGKVVEGYAPSQEALCSPLTRALAIAAFRDISNPLPPPELRVHMRLVLEGQTPVTRDSAVDTAYIGRTYDLWVQVVAPEFSTLYLSAAWEGFAEEPDVIYPLAEDVNKPVALNVWVRVLQDYSIGEPPGLEAVKLYVGSDQFDFGRFLASLYHCRRYAVPPPAVWAPERVEGWNTWDYRFLVVRPNGAAGAVSPGRRSYDK